MGTLWTSATNLDEIKFNIYDSDGSQYYWHDLEMEQEVHCSRKFVEIWRGFSACRNYLFEGKTGLHRPQSHHENNFDFQQDSAPNSHLKEDNGIFPEKSWMASVLKVDVAMDIFFENGFFCCEIWLFFIELSWNYGVSS